MRAAQHQLEGAFVGQHVLAEAGGQFGQARHDLCVALLLRRGHQRTRPHEVEVNPFQQAFLLCRERHRLALGV